MKIYNLKIRDRVLQEANEFRICKDATVRSVAKTNNVSKSTVHRDLSERLKHIDSFAYVEVREKLDINKQERHIRGGEATKRKYLVKASKQTIM